MENYGTITTIVWIVFFGVCYGAFYAFYHRRLLGNILRAIISKGAQDEKSAVTLSDIGYGSGLRRRFAKFALGKGSVLRKTIETVYEEKAPEKKNDDELFVKAPVSVEEQKYFVPEEKRITAEVRYDGKGTTVLTLVVTVVSFFAAAVIIISLLPWILNNITKLENTDDEDRQEQQEQSVYDAEADNVNDPENADGEYDSTKTLASPESAPVNVIKPDGSPAAEQ